MTDITEAARQYREWAKAIADLTTYHTAENTTEICPCCAFSSERADAASIAYDLAVAERHAGRDGGPRLIAAWRLPRPEATRRAPLRPQHMAGDTRSDEGADA